ncbi:hypothetical protein HaLaN_31796 [Haematococcus lacustris]|uniref:Uncharacterized protein n=1 Tax=Haematococcus lacustris TaxID=44745 RepID=A0A6A0AL33_HAELA|nr:hypothetical protein HaLaN_31796 [Haematococcus lacustris]
MGLHSNQGVPWPGLQAAARQATQGPAAACCGTVGSGNDVGGRHSCTMSMCTGYTPHSPITPFESGDYCSLVFPLVAASGHYWSG